MVGAVRMPLLSAIATPDDSGPNRWTATAEDIGPRLCFAEVE
jgi:hypothetical protein